MCDLVYVLCSIHSPQLSEVTKTLKSFLQELSQLPDGGMLPCDHMIITHCVLCIGRSHVTAKDNKATRKVTLFSNQD